MTLEVVYAGDIPVVREAITAPPPPPGPSKYEQMVLLRNRMQAVLDSLPQTPQYNSASRRRGIRLTLSTFERILAKGPECINDRVPQGDIDALAHDVSSFESHLSLDTAGRVLGILATLGLFLAFVLLCVAGILLTGGLT